MFLSFTCDNNKVWITAVPLIWIDVHLFNQGSKELNTNGVQSEINKRAFIKWSKLMFTFILGFWRRRKLTFLIKKEKKKEVKYFHIARGRRKNLFQIFFPCTAVVWKNWLLGEWHRRENLALNIPSYGRIKCCNIYLFILT